jgi:hypothetical protein
MSEHNALDPQEREAILKMAGLSDDLVNQVEHAPPTAVSDTAVQSDTTTSDTLAEGEWVQQASEACTIDEHVSRILAKSAGNQDKAMKLVDDHVQAEFNRLKLSKIQAALQGADSAEHNRNAWAHVQKLRGSMKAKVRGEFRTNAGFVKAKIVKAKALTTKQEDFLRDHQDNDVLQQFLALQAGA